MTHHVKHAVAESVPGTPTAECRREPLAWRPTKQRGGVAERQSKFGSVAAVDPSLAVPDCLLPAGRGARCLVDVGEQLRCQLPALHPGGDHPSMDVRLLSQTPTVVGSRHQPRPGVRHRSGKQAIRCPRLSQLAPVGNEQGWAVAARRSALMRVALTSARERRNERRSSAYIWAANASSAGPAVTPKARPTRRGDPAGLARRLELTG